MLSERAVSGQARDRRWGSGIQTEVQWVGWSGVSCRGRARALHYGFGVAFGPVEKA